MKPVTGVTDLNKSAGEWFWDRVYQGIEPAYVIAHANLVREFFEKHKEDEVYEVPIFDEVGYDEVDLLADAVEHADYQMENWDSDCMILVGDWKRTNDDSDPRVYPTYDVDYEGKLGWAGVYRRDSGSILQVVHSKFAMPCRKCSPCYPGQGDLDTPGDDYLAYCLPPEEWDDGYREEHEHRVREVPCSDTPE